MNKKILALAIGIVVIVLGIGAGLYFYWTSPEYCFQQAQEAVQTHNEKQFARYTDLDGLCNSSYLMFQNYEASRDAELMHSRTCMIMFLQVRNLIQPEAVASAKKAILSYVKMVAGHMGPKPVNMSAVEWQTLWTFPIRRYLMCRMWILVIPTQW